MQSWFQMTTTYYLKMPYRQEWRRLTEVEGVTWGQAPLAYLTTSGGIHVGSPLRAALVVSEQVTSNAW